VSPPGSLERPDGKLHLYSGHDWTVTPLLMTVSQPDDPRLRAWAPFCASIAFELWSSRPADALSHWAALGQPSAADDGRYVRVLWNGEPVALPGGVEVCPSVLIPPPPVSWIRSCGCLFVMLFLSCCCCV